MAVKIIEVKESVFKNNNERADKLRNRLKEEKREETCYNQGTSGSDIRRYERISG